MRKEIYLIRHAEAESNIDDVMRNPNSQAKLTPSGFHQALELRNSSYMIPELIISSEFKRAKDTAVIFSNNKIDLETNPLFNEWLDCDVEENQFLTRNERKVIHEQSWLNYNPNNIVHPKGESFESFWHRLDKANELLKQKRENLIYVISHAAFIKGLMFFQNQSTISMKTMQDFHIYIKKRNCHTLK